MRQYPERAALVAALLLALGLSPLFAQDSRPESQPAGKEPAAVTKQKPHPALLDPKQARDTAPAEFHARFETTKGDFVIKVTREWAPLGADRFYNLAKIGYFEDVAFFRVISGFMAQFGLHGDPKVWAAWRTATIQDDPVKQSNKRGFVTFAKTGAPNSRTTQLFINYGDNARLDGMQFAPFGQVVEGMEVVDALYNGYGEGAPRGRGPSQQTLGLQGNKYLKESFPKLDYIKKVTVVDGASGAGSEKE